MRVETLDLLFLNTPGLIAAHLLECDGELALIETGPGSCHAALVAALQTHGVQPQDIRKVFVTHIHLDHAGGAGWWAQQGAQVYMHGKGAPHLIDPTKLINSASRIYGSDMERLWGSILPAPAERVTVLADGDEVLCGNALIQAWDTPGHARHHLAYSVEGVCFTGDVAGVRLAGCDYISVAAAPPQFEPGPYVGSVERLARASFERLYLAHFGAVDDVETHLARYADRITEVHEQVQGWYREGLRGTEIAQRFTASEKATAESCGLSEQDWQRYELGNSSVMCASGIELCCAKAG